MKINTKVKA